MITKQTNPFKHGTTSFQYQYIVLQKSDEMQ